MVKTDILEEIQQSWQRVDNSKVDDWILIKQQKYLSQTITIKSKVYKTETQIMSKNRVLLNRL